MDIAEVTVTPHFRKQMEAKGFTAEQVIDALTAPYKVTDVTRYPGQKRYCGRLGLAVVARDNVLVTCYLDGVVTPLREDQKNDNAAINSRRLNNR